MTLTNIELKHAQSNQHLVLLGVVDRSGRCNCTIYSALGKCLATRVYNKERKRVSNVLYGPCNMCSESHAPGIQTLTNESADSNNELWAWPQVQTNTSAIAAENANRSRSQTSVHEESSIKLTKNAPICRSPEKNRVFSDLV